MQNQAEMARLEAEDQEKLEVERKAKLDRIIKKRAVKHRKEREEHEKQRLEDEAKQVEESKKKKRKIKPYIPKELPKPDPVSIDEDEEEEKKETSAE